MSHKSSLERRKQLTEKIARLRALGSRTNDSEAITARVIAQKLERELAAIVLTPEEVETERADTALSKAVLEQQEAEQMAAISAANLVTAEEVMRAAWSDLQSEVSARVKMRMSGKRPQPLSRSAEHLGRALSNALMAGCGVMALLFLLRFLIVEFSP